MTIHEIKARTQTTSPHFFTSDTMKFFNQTLRQFTVKKQGDKYLISCPMRDHSGRLMGYTKRLFNPATNELERVN